MEVVPEMQKLRNWLDEHEIPWEDASDDYKTEISGYEYWICRTWFAISNKWSVINGYGTYGGVQVLNKQNLGLLEVSTKSTGIVGFLTADDVIQAVEKEMKECGME